MPTSKGQSHTDRQKKLEIIKNLVAGGDYHYSRKGRDFIADGSFGTEDLEKCIMMATSIHKAEEDELGSATDGNKYTILGRDTQGQSFYTCGKIILDKNDQRKYFFITAHESR